MNKFFPARIELEYGPVSALNLALYAAASGDHNALHLDVEAAKSAGFDRPVVHGMLTMAVCARLLTSHFGVRSLRSLDVRFIGAAVRGDHMAITGILNKIDQGVATYDLACHTIAGNELLAGSARIAALREEDAL